MLNLDPRKMQEIMRQMGMSQESIDAERVIIEKSDGEKIVISNPSIARIKMQGQESFQISGEISENSNVEGFTEEDIKTVMEKTGFGENEAGQALKNSRGDLAGAILELKDKGKN